MNSIQQQKYNWLYNGSTKSNKGICERYQSEIDNLPNAKRKDYANKILQRVKEHTNNLEALFVQKQKQLEKLFNEFTLNEKNNIFPRNGIMSFNGFCFLTDSQGFAGLNPKYSEDGKEYFENAQDILQEIDNFVVLLCELKKTNMLEKYILQDKNENLASATIFQNEYKMLAKNIPFIHSEYSPIYRSILRNFDVYVAHLDAFAVKTFEKQLSNHSREVCLTSRRHQQEQEK